jgi:hypothetical protein
MPGHPKKQPFFWFGLAAITLLYCLYYLYFLNNVSHDMPLRTRHIIKFLSILIAYGIGTYTLRKYTTGWIMQIWHAAYAIILCLLLLLGIYDWGIARVPVQIRGIADNLQEFLISPVLYVVIGIINRSLAK